VSGSRCQAFAVIGPRKSTHNLLKDPKDPSSTFQESFSPSARTKRAIRFDAPLFCGHYHKLVAVIVPVVVVHTVLLYLALRFLLSFIQSSIIASRCIMTRPTKAPALLLLCIAAPSTNNAFTNKPSTSHTTSSCTALHAKIGLFFGTSTGSTEEAADLIAAEFGSDVVEGPIEIDTIQGSVAAEFAKHDALVVGTPTWNTGADTERSGTGWDEIYYGEMQDLQIQGKPVAVFGLGDSVSYTENYADASGELHDVFEGLGAKMMGYTSQEGYEHEDSKAIRGDLFCGLLLDAVNQEDLTPERVQKWVAQLKDEGILEGSGAGSTSGSVPGPAVEVVEQIPAAINGLAQYEEENALLQTQLDENSVLLDETISVHSSGFTPHYNPKTQRTMFTSPDGRKCYYTDAAPKMNMRASP